MQTPRVPVFVRLLLILVGVAALPTGVVMVAQERALTRDLREAAAARLERASHAGARLLDDHLADLAARYRAVSGTPQFRATLELGDAATLRFYAGELSRRQGALAVAFVSAAGAVTEGGAEPELARQAWERDLDPVVERAGRLLTVTRVPLHTGPQQVGWLVAVDDISASILDDWSDTCGAELAYELSVEGTRERLVRSVRSIGSGHLTISSSLEAEAKALAHARRNLATAGSLALALAIGASILLSRSWVRPIHRMRQAAERIGRGDFEARVRIRRGDEIGDVAHAFDEMARRLSQQQQALESQLRELHDGRERLRNAQRLARMGSWRFRVDAKQVEVSEELADMLGLPAGQPTLDLDELLALVHPEERETLARAARDCLEQGSSLHADHRVVLPDGSERILQTQARVRRDPEDGAVLLDGTAQDVTERKRSEEQIRFLAYHDGLTGLGNRQLFQERLDLAIAEGRRSGQPFGVLFVDLDQFKRINDTLGHSVGDLLLQGVADRLVSSVRESDLVARGDFTTAVSRFGGDEFVVLATGLSHVRELARIARRLLVELAHPFSLQGHEIVTTVSIGIAAWPDDGDDVESLLRNADAAMHHAKEQGRNNHQFYAAAMNEEALQRLILESRLRRALESSEFELHYQPKLDAAGERVVGVEALARWRDPELGMVLPDEFIPIAEETGLISALGAWAMREACAQRRRWSDAGLPPVPVAVNLSAHEFRDGRLVERVESILEETGAEPELLELEITESTLLHDEATVVAALEALRKLGVQVAVDDFGTGYSSLAYLGRLPVDALKIDRGFVLGIAENRGEAALTAAIVAMGHALELRVVAEGVETEAQGRLLRSWGCDELQGFLFARPMPAARLEAWWRSAGPRRA